MRIVALGGTGFLSAGVVAHARAAGHDVAVVSRGTHGAPPPGVTWLRADRDDATALAEAVTGVGPDAVIDSCGYTVAGAHAAAGAFAGVERYVYVSSISAYRDWPPGPIPDETAPLFSSEDDLDDYGPMKAESERVLGAAVRGAGGTFLAARAGLIIGPGDRTRRMTTWLHRIATQDRLAVPDRLDQAMAFVDARDLAAWLVAGSEQGLDGPFNATGPAAMTTLGALLEDCRAVVRDAGRTPAELEPVSEEELLAAGVEPWRDLPFWLPAEVATTAWQVGTERAHEHGLGHRALAATLADTWAWLDGAGVEHPPLPSALADLAARR